jgi:hypothetical protein
LLTAGLRSKPQNSRFLPKFSEAVWNPFKKTVLKFAPFSVCPRAVNE